MLQTLQISALRNAASSSSSRRSNSSCFASVFVYQARQDSQPEAQTELGSSSSSSLEQQLTGSSSSSSRQAQKSSFVARRSCYVWRESGSSLLGVKKRICERKKAKKSQEKETCGVHTSRQRQEKRHPPQTHVRLGVVWRTVEQASGKFLRPTRR